MNTLILLLPQDTKKLARKQNTTSYPDTQYYSYFGYLDTWIHGYLDTWIPLIYDFGLLTDINQPTPSTTTAPTYYCYYRELQDTDSMDTSDDNQDRRMATANCKPLRNSYTLIWTTTGANDQQLLQRKISAPVKSITTTILPLPLPLLPQPLLLLPPHSTTTTISPHPLSSRFSPLLLRLLLAATLHPPSKTTTITTTTTAVAVLPPAPKF